MTTHHVKASSAKSAKHKVTGPRTVATKVNKIKETGRKDIYSVRTKKRAHPKK